MSIYDEDYYNDLPPANTGYIHTTAPYPAGPTVYTHNPFTNPTNPPSLEINAGDEWEHPHDNAFFQWPAWQTMGTGTGASGLSPSGVYHWGGQGPTPAPYGMNPYGVPYAGPVGAGEGSTPSGGGGGVPSGAAIAMTPGMPGGRINQYIVHGY